MKTILEAAQRAYKAGLCVLPVKADGSKAPAVLEWMSYQTTRPSIRDMQAWRFQDRDGLGIVAGTVSGSIEAWDFDDVEIAVAFEAAAHACGLGDVWMRLTAGYFDTTPGQGVRILVKYPTTLTFTDCTLARRPGRDGEPPIKVLIELPMFSIVAPSAGGTHPTGRAYERITGDFNTIASYAVDERAELIRLARSFDQLPAREYESAIVRTSTQLRPGDAFNSRASWTDILPDWMETARRGDVVYLRRPGKDRGVSATINARGTDRLHVFTSSTSFDANTSYSKFGAYTLLQHGGDFAAAARTLAQQGYGDPLSSADRSSETTSSSATSASSTNTAAPILVRLVDVHAEPVRWLWPGRLAAGKLSLWIGDPGLGKSWLTLDAAARTSTGRVWPDGSAATTAASVLLLSAEDGLADTIRPRLDALEADVTRIHHLAVLKVGQTERAVQLSDSQAIEAAIVACGAQLVVIDPVSAYLGNTDSHRDGEVRGLLAPLAAVAERTGAAVLGVMHLAKSAQRPAIYRAVGSIGFAASARMLLAVAIDPNREERRLLLSVKNNLASKPPTLAFTIANDRLVWEPDPVVDVDVDAILAGPGFDREERREAEQWLSEQLAAGPVQSRILETAAREAGLAWRTVQRAKHRLGIDADKVGYADGRWYWSLPKTATSSKAATNDEVAAFDKSSEKLAVSSKTATDPSVALFDATDLPVCLRELAEPDRSDPIGAHDDEEGEL